MSYADVLADCRREIVALANTLNLTEGRLARALADAARERSRADKAEADLVECEKGLRYQEEAEIERYEVAARVKVLEAALAEAAVPLEAFHMDLDNAWELSDAAKVEIRNAVGVIRSALRGAGEEGAGDERK